MILSKKSATLWDHDRTLPMLNLDRTSRFIFQAACLGVLGAALLNGPYRTDAQTLALTTAATGLTLGSVPATVTLTSLPGFAPALRAAQNSAAPVILTIEGITGKPAHPLRINVFVGRPDATLKTSTNDPHFVGYIAIAPKYGAEPARGIEISRGFDVSNLDISSDDEGLRVTLVPVAGLAEAPRDLSLQIRRIYFHRGE
jgi:hypothetical protein